MVKVVGKKNSELAIFEPYKKELNDFTEKYSGILYDLNDSEQYAASNKDKKAIIAVINRLDESHKEVVGDLKARTKAIDKVRKSIKDPLDQLREDIHNQHVAHREAIEAAKQLIRDKYNNLLNLGVFGVDEPTVEDIQDRIDTLLGIEIDDSYDHMYEDAVEQHAKLTKSLNKMLKRAVKAKEEQEELAELRRKQAEADAVIAEGKREKERVQREEAIRIKAEKDAAEAIELKEKQLEEALAKAEADKLAAVEAEKLRAAKELQAQKEQDLAEQQRIEKEAKRREADKKHKAKIHNAILAEFTKKGISEKIGKAIITKIAKRKVPNIVINY